MSAWSAALAASVPPWSSCIASSGAAADKTQRVAAIGERDALCAEAADRGDGAYRLEAATRSGGVAHYVVLHGPDGEGPLWTKDPEVYRILVRGVGGARSGACLPLVVGRRLGSHAELKAYWAGAGLGLLCPEH